MLSVVCFTFSSWTIDIIISCMWQYCCSVLPQDLLLKKLKRWKTTKKTPMAMSPNKQTPATRGPCHRLSMLKRHQWPFPHRAAKSELPVHTDSLSIHFTTGEKKTITQKPFPKNSDLHPRQPSNSLFWGSILYTPAMYTLSPQKTYIFCKITCFSILTRRKNFPSKHSSHLAFSKAFAFRSGRTWNQLTSSETKAPSNP